MKPHFADSFYYIALLNSLDGAHAKVVDFSMKFSGQVLTTVWVLTEVGDAFSSKSLRPAFVQLIQQIENDSKTLVIAPSKSLFKEGVALFATRKDKNWSLTDCISFVVMKNKGLKRALTGDHHFVQAGFEIEF